MEEAEKITGFTDNDHQALLDILKGKTVGQSLDFLENAIKFITKKSRECHFS